MRACVLMRLLLPLLDSAGAPPVARDPAAEVAARQAAQREALSLLLRADRTKARVALELMQKVVGNILSDPAQPKYRTLKVDNAAIKEKVLSCPGEQAAALRSPLARTPTPNPNQQPQPRP